MASLNATVGQTINEWAGGSPRQGADSIQKALDWDANRQIRLPPRNSTVPHLLT